MGNLSNVSKSMPKKISGYNPKNFTDLVNHFSTKNNSKLTLRVLEERHKVQKPLSKENLKI